MAAQAHIADLLRLKARTLRLTPTARRGFAKMLVEAESETKMQDHVHDSLQPHD
jgi:hypothetical protein